MSKSGKSLVAGGQLSLPFWPEQMRGVPWAAVRSALFAPVKPGARGAMQRAEIAAVGDFRIIYTGIRLDQADLDVYEQVLHVARATPLGEAVRFKTREMLRALDRETGKSDREWLFRALSRLAACEIEITNGKVAYAGSLIQEQGRDEEAGTHYIVLNPRLGALYSHGWAPVKWEERKALGGRQLAKWLHGFIAGGQNPVTFNIAALMRLANSGYERARDFRQAMDEAGAALRAIQVDVLLVWDLKRDQVTITRAAWNRQGATAIPHRGDSGRA